ncbi:RNA polymerase sigma factor [Spongiimicrobium sp. 3-5]|uniref:RNA polymerase sigma factor n=1 Tax=Spongiimicrobium sp. 3-5 TaxID=3332596 RepID=UPI0039813A0B
MVESLYKKFYGKLYQYGCLVYDDTIKVEDTIQNFFVWTLENPEKLRDIKNFEAFACKAIRRNLIQGIIKDTRSKKSHDNYVVTLVDEKSITSVEKEIMQVEENSCLKTNLKSAIEKLPDKQKEIIYLKYYANFSYKEIEDIMNVSNQVARNYVSRALKKLKSSIFSEKMRSFIVSAFLV